MTRLPPTYGVSAEQWGGGLNDGIRKNGVSADCSRSIVVICHVPRQYGPCQVCEKSGGR
ncbi:hypothetical protein K443DRAFT_334607 [Laccaria amethystina LaAM-08-1]|uniref:Uncharacterized protein n=1 Tax=Laccaria amethystina LaAM-08-1 TaxID=1095629 RepID=A0A0C9X0P1_9AGAR|nr:hypothetical protein K443DRAFT_334607 [Laccaria amethystina LaAM-08-1]